MPENRKCRGCEADVPVNAPFGHCPKCLLDLGFGPIPDEDEGASTVSASGNRVFGDYELLEQIGRGGMGVVYKARQMALNRPVALKMINAGEFASPMLIQRFHREAEAAANLHHPNIVPIYETGEKRGQHYLSMALIEGLSLDEHVKRLAANVGSSEKDARAFSRRRQEDIARLIAKVARAVDYAHHHGVLHRDLKPSNIIVDQSGEPHLTDFGVAKVLGSGDSNLTASGAIMGTPSYMAPEQAAGQSKRSTTAADVYSLGAILYAMLTGNPPFQADTPVETLRLVVEKEPKHPSTLVEGIDSDLATIAMKCLEKEPTRRYATAAALAEDFERWLRREPILARSIGTGERFWRWCRRNPKETLLGSSVALLLLCLAVGATAFAVRVNHLNQTLENKNYNLLRSVLPKLVEVYEDPDFEEFQIESDMRRALYDQSPLHYAPGEATVISFIEDIYEHPTNMLATLAPILYYLEEEMRTLLQHPVAIHLRLCKTSETRSHDMEATNAVFSRMGPSGYALRRQTNSSLRLIALQDHRNPLTMVLFTRTNSDVSRLISSHPETPLRILLAGRSLALSGASSTTGNYVPKWFLSANGVFASTLAGYMNLDGQRRVFDAILDGAFDVGSGNMEFLNRYPGLHVIATNVVPDLGRCWVAGRGMSVRIENALREALLKLRDPKVLAGLESETVGFKILNDEGFSRLRSIMRGAAAFDSKSDEPVK